MLNSVPQHHPHYHQYSLKLKSMFELAVAASQHHTQQYHQHQQQQEFQSHLQAYQAVGGPEQSTSPPHHHHHQHPHSLAYDKHTNYNNNNNNNNNNNRSSRKSVSCEPPHQGSSSGGSGMEESSSGGGGEHLYSTLPQNHDSSSSSSNNSSMSPTCQQQESLPISHQINFFNPHHHHHHQGLIMSMVNVGVGMPCSPSAETGAKFGGGTPIGKKKGAAQLVTNSQPHAGKASFSIESLLAHSNSWNTRRNQPQAQQQQQNECSGGGSTLPSAKHLKDSRFNPYPTTQQGRGEHGGTLCTLTARQAADQPMKPAVSQTTSPQAEDEIETGSKSGGSNNTNNNNNNSNGRRAAKSKRVRTIFTPEQLERLEAEFERQQYMVGPERLYLASSLYLTEAQVKVWFQNRRIKWRKQHLEMEQQRLAIYRTLAEQDMMQNSSSEGLDEDDDDPDEEEEDDEEAGQLHDEKDGGRGFSAQQEGDHDPDMTTTREGATQDLKFSPSPPPGAGAAPSSKGKVFIPSEHHPPEPRLRIPLQQSFNLNAEDYVASSSSEEYPITSPSATTSTFHMRRDSVDSSSPPHPPPPSHHHHHLLHHGQPPGTSKK